MRSSRFLSWSIASNSPLVRFLYCLFSLVGSLSSFLTASQKVSTEWWIFVGSQSLFGLNICSSDLFCAVFSPKYDFSLILLKNWFVSSCITFLLYLSGVGQKFKFLPNNLKACILKFDFERFIMLPNGSALYSIVAWSVSRIRLMFALRWRCSRGLLLPLYCRSFVNSRFCWIPHVPGGWGLCFFLAELLRCRYLLNYHHSSRCCFC